MYQVGAGFVRDVQEMRREIEELRSLVIRLQQEKPRQVILRQQLAYIGATAITAADYGSLGPGTGTVTLYHYDRTDSTIKPLKDKDDNDITQDVFNYTETVSGTNVYAWVGQDTQGAWWYLNEACP